jgi:hypothetical protein
MMKQVVSVSLGSRDRDHEVDVTLLGEQVHIRREGTDGDEAAFRRRLLELDGQVDAFGIGGAHLGMDVESRYYPLHSVQKLVKGVQTPMVDGGGLRAVVERQLRQTLDTALPWPMPKRALIGTAVARYDLALSFYDAGYEMMYGDLGFSLGIPIVIRKLSALRMMARTLLPILGYLPLSMLYPTGGKQSENTPKFGNWFSWATVVADDFHYIKKFMPLRLDGKVIVTNTTTAKDVALLQERGAAFLCTSTPQLEGRTFGTNVIEAALTAVAGVKRPLTTTEIQTMVNQLDMKPQVIPLQ